MKKRLMLALTLILCLAVLCSCGAKEQTRYQVIGTNVPQATQNLNMGGAAQPQLDINFDDGSYDPTQEKGEDEPFVPEQQVAMVTVAPTMTSEYAGATPVIIDPIDKPTPSPVPPLSFSYQVYDATNIHLSFEAPVGWMVESPSSDTFVITNPSRGVDYAASVSISAQSVSSNYSTSDMKKTVENLLDTIGESGFDSYSPSRTAERPLLDSKGVYANYSGKMAGGIEVAGRVHVTCVNKVLYTVHVTYPKAYTETYKEQVYDKLRDTIMITQ